MSETDSTKIGRMDANVTNLMDWKRQHEDHDQQRFDKTFEYIKDGFDKMEERFDKMDDRLDTLWDDKNKKQGSDGLKKFLYTGGMSLLAIVAGYLGGSHK